MNPPSQPLPFRPRRATLEKLIRSIAQNDEKITWAEHAFERSDEREITIDDALLVLRIGLLDDEIVPGNRVGEWKGKMTMHLKGRREAGVVVIVIKDQSLFVKTVEWENLR